MIIIGAGAAGLETFLILLSTGYKAEILFYDENQSIPNVINDSCKVIHNENTLIKQLKFDPHFVVAIGNPRIREKMTNKMIRLGGKPSTIKADNHSCLSLIPENGSILQPGVVISTNVIIGQACMIHANTVIGHSVNIGDFVSISPLVSVIGPCSIGKYTFIGAGSVILPKISIGQNVIVPAGSIVNRSLKDYETF